MHATQTNHSFFIGKKTTWLLGFLVWILGFLLSFIIMALLEIRPEQSGENWGINHPKYLQFEVLMISSMILIMFIVVKLFYASKETLPSRNETLIDGSIIMIIQFILDFLVFAVLFGAGLGYFLAFVTIGYLTIPLQFWLFTRIKF